MSRSPIEPISFLLELDVSSCKHWVKWGTVYCTVKPSVWVAVVEPAVAVTVMVYCPLGVLGVVVVVEEPPPHATRNNAPPRARNSSTQLRNFLRVAGLRPALLSNIAGNNSQTAKNTFDRC